MCARQIVTDFARRAFRRPVTRTRADAVRQPRSAGGEGGRSLAEGLAVGTQAILVSPDFLFRIERDHPAPGRRPLRTIRSRQHELASRLSYFLWSSMPDAQLRRAADTGTLRNPAVLDGAGSAHAARSEVARAGGELRRPVAAVPRAGIGDARPRALSGLRRLPALLDAAGDRAVPRERDSARTAASSISSTASTRS